MRPNLFIFNDVYTTNTIFLIEKHIRARKISTQMPKSISKNTAEHRSSREAIRRQTKRTRARHRKKTERDGNRNNQSTRQIRIES